MSPDNPYERGQNNPEHNDPMLSEPGFAEPRRETRGSADTPGDRTETMRTHPQRDRNKSGSGDIRISTGDMAAYINPELILYVLSVIAMFVASIVVDENDDGTGFGADKAWLYFVLLTVGYFISRGLTKSGRR